MTPEKFCTKYRKVRIITSSEVKPGKLTSLSPALRDGDLGDCENSDTLISEKGRERGRELTVSPCSTLRSTGRARRMFTSAICSFSSVLNVVLSSLSSSTFERNVSNSSMKLVGTAAVSAIREARMIACCPTIC